VPLRTYRRWSAHGNPHPGAVRLLALLAGFVPFEGWQGWEFDNGCLFPPGYSKNGLTPGDFFALVFQRQLISAYLLFPALYRKAVPRYFRTGQDSFSRIIWHRSEHDSASREPVRAPRVSV
jgi:hypothetical protein